jgi:hypothetical protein
MNPLHTVFVQLVGVVRDECTGVLIFPSEIDVPVPPAPIQSPCESNTLDARKNESQHLTKLPWLQEATGGTMRVAFTVRVS